MAKDFYHKLVREALEADGWKVTHDPYSLKEWDPKWEIDLGADRVIGAERKSVKIAVEVKSFIRQSTSYEFHAALGQYMNYIVALENIEQDRQLYMAVPLDIWTTTFQKKGIKASLEKYQVKLVIYDIETEKIVAWKASN